MVSATRAPAGPVGAIAATRARPRRIVLASSSERRAAALREQAVPFTQLTPSVDERRRRGEVPADYVRRVAATKCEAGVKARRGAIVIAADTTVVLHDGTFLHKPQTTRQAAITLRRLRGGSCLALTGLAVGSSIPGRVLFVSSVVTSKVTFRQFDDAELRWYVGTGEPLEKAGAFGIQGLGAALVASLAGCYSNVVGLPLCELNLILGLVGPEGALPALSCSHPDGSPCPRLEGGRSEQRWLWRSE